MQTRRAMLDAMLEYFNNQARPPADGVQITDQEVTTADGATLPATRYQRPSGDTGAPMLYLHGGAMIAGSVPIFGGLVSRYVARAGALTLSMAPEHPHPVPPETPMPG